MPKKITAKKAIKLLRKAVEIKGPDHKYVVGNNGSCLYTHDGKTGACIVGKVFEQVGVDMSKFLTSNYGINSTSIAYFRQYPNRVEELDLELTESAIEILRTAQRRQDVGSNWGDALDEAESTYKSLKKASK